MNATRTLAVVLMCAVTMACASGKGPSPILCSQIGILAGGGGGAAIGGSSQSGSDAGPIIAGGLIGAIVGGATGYFLCKAFQKEEKPKAKPKPAPPKAEPEPEPPPPDPCDQVIRLRGVQFDFDKSAVRPDAVVILDEAIVQVSEPLAQCPDKRISVEGHTDSTGPEEYNQGLSERRAAAVEAYLVEHGLDGSRLSTAGYGEANPIAPNETREGRALNRRVELRLVD